MGTAAQVQDFYSLLKYPGPNALITYLWPRRLRSYVPAGQEGFTFLDAGCGSGRHSAGMLDLYPNARGYCLDFSANSLKEADALFTAKGLRDRASFLNQSYLDPIALPDKVDVAMAIGTIHHCPDPAGALCNIASMVKPGGIVAFMVYGERGHRRRYEVKEAIHLATSDPAEALSMFKAFQTACEGFLDVPLRVQITGLRRRVSQKLRLLAKIFGSKSHGYYVGLNNDLFRMDAIMNPIDVAFDASGVQSLIEGAGLEPLVFLGLGRDEPGLLPPGWLPHYEKLGYWERVRVMEILDPVPASWSIICRVPG